MCSHAASNYFYLNSIGWSLEEKLYLMLTLLAIIIYLSNVEGQHDLEIEKKYCSKFQLK